MNEAAEKNKEVEFMENMKWLDSLLDGVFARAEKKHAALALQESILRKRAK